MTEDARYPALMVDWLTPVYDHFVKLFLREKKIKRELVDRARIAPGHRALDVGAGTGTLAIEIKQAQPDARVTGLDGDPKILAIAREKAKRAGVEIDFETGNATALPYPDGSFDRVLSSLVYSLLSGAEKRQAAREAHRVLKRDGEVYIADFGPPRTRWGRVIAPRMRRFEPIRDNLDGRLPGILGEAGFREVREVARFATALGTISILAGRKQG